MITLVQGSVTERVSQLTLGSGLQITQDTNGLATLDTNPASFMTQAQGDLRYLQLSGGTLTGGLTGTTLNLSGTLTGVAVNLSGALSGTTGSFTGLLKSDGNVRAGVVGSVGYVQMTQGSGSATGYVEFYSAANVRQGYIGFAASGIVLNMEVGNFVINNASGVTRATFTNAGGSFVGAYSFSSTLTASSGFTVTAGSISLPSASIADAALTSNIPKINSANVFTTVNTFPYISLGGAVNAKITLTGSPTAVQQIIFGDSSVFSSVGSVYSSGNMSMTFNAYQTYNTDQWTQSNTAFPSAMIELTGTGRLLFSSAAAGKSPAAKATFWGSVPLFQITEVGNVFAQTFYSIQRAGVDKGYFWVSTGADIGITGSVTDDVMIRTTGGRFLVSVDNGASAMYQFSSTQLQTATLPISFTYYYTQNYGHGMIGVYDPAKYRLIYAIGDSYKPGVSGTSITGAYGLFMIYDDTSGLYINATGHTLGHGIAVVNNGSIVSVMATGFWTSGSGYFGAATYQNGIDIAKVIVQTAALNTGDAAPASGAGTIKLRVT